MTGMAGDIATTDEASEPITTKTNTTDTVAGRVNESASQVHERIANQLQPGDTRATSPRLSDTPSNAWQSREERPSEVSDHGIVNDKSLLQSAQETVAKALGGGSRGAS